MSSFTHTLLPVATLYHKTIMEKEEQMQMEVIEALKDKKNHKKKQKQDNNLKGTEYSQPTKTTSKNWKVVKSSGK